MEIQASRCRARIGPRASRYSCSTRTARAGTSCSSRRGLAALDRARSTRRRAWARTRSRRPSPPAMHARGSPPTRTGSASSPSTTRSPQLPPSPVVELNRAVAVAMAFGPEAGLELVDALASEPALRGYHLLPSVRGDLLAKLGRGDEARGSSTAPPRSPKTPASAQCCSSGWRPARPRTAAKQKEAFEVDSKSAVISHGRNLSRTEGPCPGARRWPAPWCPIKPAA